VGNYFYVALENGEVVHIRQKERNQFLKNEEYQRELSKVIDKLRARDTEGNIKNLTNELEKLEEGSLRKSISMYKIN
jgi:hypothetical protein